jgi:hypothetical protein
MISDDARTQLLRLVDKIDRVYLGGVLQHAQALFDCMPAQTLMPPTKKPLPPTPPWSSPVALPTINASGKIWFAHVHKAAGHSFLADLGELVGSGCWTLTCCRTQGAELARLREWWSATELAFAAYPALRAEAALAQPKKVRGALNGTALPTCLHNEDRIARLLSQLQLPLQPRNNEPAIVTMVRHPVSQCRSNWAYFRLICPKNSGPRCLRSYPDSPDGQQHFVERVCSKFEGQGDWDVVGIHSPRAAYSWIERHVQFWGLTERYALSLCLLWFQMGLNQRLRNCSFSSGSAIRYHHTGTITGNYSTGPLTITAQRDSNTSSLLSMSDEEVARVLRADIELYGFLERGFELRVLSVESRTGMRLLHV